MKVEIINQQTILESKSDKNNITLFYNQEYKENDYIYIYPDVYPTYLWIKLDDAIEGAIVYIKDKFLKYKIPIEEERKAYNYKAFYNNKHLIKVRTVSLIELTQYQNLAYNPYDVSFQNNYYPHAYSSEDLSLKHVFQARNCIDGLTLNNSHGRWPYTSWSNQQNLNAILTIDFGRKVDINLIEIYLRADFPHDSYFSEILLSFSDDSKQVVKVYNAKEKQSIRIDKEHIEWVKLSHFKKYNNHSLFTAISQVEVYGYNKIM